MRRRTKGRGAENGEEEKRNGYKDFCLKNYVLKPNYFQGDKIEKENKMFP